MYMRGGYHPHNYGIKKENNSKETESTVSTYDTSIFLSKTKQTEISNSKLISNFIEFCNNGDIQSAYNMLSEKCKNKLFPTMESFKNGYSDKLFNVQRLFLLRKYI